METSAPDSVSAPLLEGRARFLAYVRKRIADPHLAEDIVQESLLLGCACKPEGTVSAEVL